MKFNDIPQLTRYGSYEVNVPLQFIYQNIKEFKEEMNLQLNPDFQRGHVWSEAQQISYVEYLLSGGNSARVIYFNKPDWNGESGVTDYNDFVCVDGLQRLTAVMKFMSNELKAFGYYLREFEDRISINVALLFNVNNLKTKKEVLKWYIEFNSAGTPHTKEEIDRVKRMMEGE